MSFLLAILKNPSFSIAILMILLVLLAKSYYYSVFGNHQLIAKIISIKTQLEHYQSEVKRYNEIANTAELHKQKLEQEREKTASIINQNRNNDACFNAPAPPAIVERLREQITRSDHHRNTTDSDTSLITLFDT